jgi:hypothetical protein
MYDLVLYIDTGLAVHRGTVGIRPNHLLKVTLTLNQESRLCPPYRDVPTNFKTVPPSLRHTVNRDLYIAIKLTLGDWLPIGFPMR